MVHLPSRFVEKGRHAVAQLPSEPRHCASTARPSSVSVYVRFAGPGSVRLPLGGDEPLFLEPAQRAVDVPDVDALLADQRGRRSRSS